jgi:hypothetical protein
MAVCKVDIPFRISQLSEFQYLVLLQPGDDRQVFLNNYSQELYSFGYVPYHWSPLTNDAICMLKYKVWVQLNMQTPLGWNIDSLLPTISTFGVLLEHSPLEQSPIIHQLNAVVAVPDLAGVPHSINMWLRGVAWSVNVKVEGWIEEEITFFHFLRPLHRLRKSSQRLMMQL